MKLALAVAAALALLASAQEFKLPPHPPAAQFGNVLISRTTATGAMKPVAFSHWRHRMRYTCRVCHLELDFAMRRNATEITQDGIRAGLHCGACHDGKIAFAAAEESNCARCHTGTTETDLADFLTRLAELPSSQYGNGVDWSRALALGKIAPVSSLSDDFDPLTLDTTLSLEANWNFVAPATFPHAEHVRWLDCANCHPSIFNVKKNTTERFSMRRTLAREFCGACHVRVAFPLDDCRRCHPTMKNAPTFGR